MMEKLMVKRMVKLFCPAVILLILIALGYGCSDSDSVIAPTPTNPIRVFTLDDNSSGCVEKLDNLVNLSVVSNDDNTLKAEYERGLSTATY